MIEALKKVLNDKKNDNFAIVIAKLGEEDSHNKMDGQAPPAKEHKEMVGDDDVDKSMVAEAEHQMSPVEEGIMDKSDDHGGLISKVKNLLMKSKKKI